MKKLLLVALMSFSLSGCALYDIYMMAGYDTNEYSLITKVRTIATVSDCSKDSVKSLYQTTVQFNQFTQYIPRNKEAHDLSKKLLSIVEELHKKDNPSPVYCQAKLNTISKTSEQIQRVIGSKQR
jgi:hypothetical protein